MSITSLPIHTCDRCGNKEELRQAERGYVWGKLLAAQANGPFRIGSYDGKSVFPAGGKDLCPNCLQSLEQWWNNP